MVTAAKRFCRREMNRPQRVVSPSFADAFKLQPRLHHTNNCGKWTNANVARPAGSRLRTMFNAFSIP